MLWPAPPRQPRGPRRSRSGSSTERLARDAREGAGAALERRALVLVAAVQELRCRVERGAERAIVRVPPEVPRARRFPGDVLHVHAFVEAEFRMRASQTGLLHATPRALARSVRVHVVVDPHTARLETPGDLLALRAVERPHGRAETELGVVCERDRLLLGR